MNRRRLKDTELLTIQQAADRSKISDIMMRKYIKDGELRVIQFGQKSIRIPLSELQRFWKNHELK